MRAPVRDPLNDPDGLGRSIDEDVAGRLASPTPDDLLAVGEVVLDLVRRLDGPVVPREPRETNRTFRKVGNQLLQHVAGRREGRRARRG